MSHAAICDSCGAVLTDVPYVKLYVVPFAGATTTLRGASDLCLVCVRLIERRMDPRSHVIDPEGQPLIFRED